MNLSSSPKVFTIRRGFSTAFFTIRVNDKQALIAFRHKKTAKQFIATENMFYNNKQVQPTAIEDIALPSLWRRCSQNSLQLIIYNDKCDYDLLEKMPMTVGDVQFYLDNNTRFIS